MTISKCSLVIIYRHLYPLASFARANVLRWPDGLKFAPIQQHFSVQLVSSCEVQNREVLDVSQEFLI